MVSRTGYLPKLVRLFVAALLFPPRAVATIRGEGVGSAALMRADEGGGTVLGRMKSAFHASRK